MIKFIEADITIAKFGVICQQVNCKGVMGAGLAKQIANKWPCVYNHYKYFITEKKLNNEPLLGTVNFVEVKEKTFVANIFGQNDYGRDGCKTDYKALKKGFEEVKHFGETNSLPILIPYNIGCGLAGGDWNKVFDIIKEVFEEDKIYICKRRI